MPCRGARGHRGGAAGRGLRAWRLRRRRRGQQLVCDGASGGGGPTVAFESIDGPPPQVFDRMVSVLDSESKLRNLSIVSREGGASYRVRSYLSAQVVRGKTVIAWVWDVYDSNQQRALRLSGEEAGRQGRTRRLGRRRRPGAAENRAGRPQRPHQHDQRHARMRRRSGPGPPRPRGGERGRGRTRAGCIRRRRAGLQRPIKRPRKVP